MLASVLGLGLLLGLHPVRVGVTFLMISRPRPLLNLLAYWVGSVVVGIPALLIPLILLHVIPRFQSITKGLANPSDNPTSRYVEIGIGALALLIAVVITVRFAMRQRAQPAMPDTGTSAGLDSNTPPAISRLLGSADDAPAEGGSVIRRLLGRVRDAWDNGALWVAWVIGIVMGPAPDLLLFVLAIIVASGAAIGIQAGAAVAFILGLLAIDEVILVGYLAAPAKTQVLLRVLHGWVSVRSQQVMAAFYAIAGVSLVAQGLGVF